MISNYLPPNSSSYSTPSAFFSLLPNGWHWKVGLALTLSVTAYLVYRIAKKYFHNDPPPNKPSHPSFPIAPTPQVEITLSLAPHVNEKIPLIELPDWHTPSLRVYNKLVTAKQGVATSIGMHTSLLLPGGTALCHKNLETLPGCSFIKMYQDNEERLEIYFNDRSYGLRLFNLLTQKINLQCDWKEVDLTPKESSFDYYHGAIVFKEPKSFLFFSRHLCSQNYQDINDFIKARKSEFLKSSLLDSLAKHNLSYSKADATIADWEEKTKPLLKRPEQMVLPPKMSAPDISKVIGTATSLLIPGWTSLKDASLHQGIVQVKMSQEEGLSLYFPTISSPSGKVIKEGAHHAEAIQTGLKSVGIDFKHNVSSLISNHPESIVLFLMRICLLRREEVLDLLKMNQIENTPFGQNIQALSQRKLVGEENYSIKILMNEKEEISVDQLSINYEQLQFYPIPDLPEIAKNIDVKERLQKTLSEVGNKVLPYADKYNLINLNGGIGNILHVLHGNAYSGVPQGEEGKRFVDKLVFVLKHIFYLLPYAEMQEVTMNMKAISIAQLAIGGMACAGGHVQAILSVYQSLKRFSPLQAHHQGNAHLKLPQVDLVVVEMIEQELQQFRSAIFQSLAEEYNHKYKGDIAHLKNKMLKAIGIKRGIPGAEMASYTDPYEACAPKLTEEMMLHDFDKRYGVEKILEYLTDKIRYQNEEIDMGKIIDFLKRHAPENVDEEDFLMSTLQDDYKRLQKKFLIQILIISDHLIYKG